MLLLVPVVIDSLLEQFDLQWITMIRNVCLFLDYDKNFSCLCSKIELWIGALHIGSFRAVDLFFRHMWKLRQKHGCRFVCNLQLFVSSIHLSHRRTSLKLFPLEGFHRSHVVLREPSKRDLDETGLKLDTD